MSLAYYIAFLLLTTLYSCTQQLNKDEIVFTIGDTKSDADNIKQQLSDDDLVSIKLPLEGHALSINGNKDHFQNIKKWWISLPEPIQSKIKKSELDIELISRVKSNSTQYLSSGKQSEQLAETSLVLEKIIGESTEMQYTINAFITDSLLTPMPLNDMETDIRLVEEVPVHLKDYNTDIFLREVYVSNDNIRTLQYWWMNLPEDIRNKVMSHELELEFTCSTLIDEAFQIERENDIQTIASENLTIAKEVLQSIIGKQPLLQQDACLAKIKSSVKILPRSKHTGLLPADSYLSIQLKKNKQFNFINQEPT
jgi:hypothetical protein